MQNSIKKEKITDLVIEEYKSAVSIFQATVDRYYKMFATILMLISILFGTLYHYNISEGFLVFVFLLLALISLESYLRFTASANAIYTEYLEKKINNINNYIALEWYHKSTHGKHLLTPIFGIYSVLFIARYVPFVILIIIILSFSLYESHLYVVSINNTFSIVYYALTALGILSIIVFNISFWKFLSKYRAELESNLIKEEN